MIFCSYKKDLEVIVYQLQDQGEDFKNNKTQYFTHGYINLNNEVEDKLKQ